MSGYQVTTPRVFEIKDPQSQVQSTLNTLNASFSFPDHTYTIDSSNLSEMYSAKLLLGGYIIRKTSSVGNITDSFDSATNIIQEFRNKCIGLTNFGSFPNGSSFKCKLFNTTQSNISLYSSNGVLVGGSVPQIGPDKTAILEIVVTGQSSLSTPTSPQTDQVWICISACAAPDILNSYYWNDWGNDVFDGWGFFYVYNTSTKKFYYLQLNPINLANGVITTQTFIAFGKSFTVKHGYPVQGIFKFELSCSDPTFSFVFGSYGDMGSDSDTINTNETQAYSLNSNSYTLYYNVNIESGDPIERLFSYFIPYQTSLNNTKTYYDFLTNGDELSLFSVPVQRGVTIYFSKQYDVKDWVLADLQESGGLITSLNNTSNPNNYQLGGNIVKDMTSDIPDPIPSGSSPADVL